MRDQWTRGVCEMEMKGHEKHPEGTEGGRLDVKTCRCYVFNGRIGSP